MKIKYFYLFGLFCSCTFHTIDDPQDIKEATVIVNDFYLCKKTRDINCIQQLMSDSLIKVIGVGNSKQLLDLIYNKFGEFQKIVIEEAHANKAVGKGSNIKYTFMIKAIYEKGKINETIGLEKFGEGKIKLASYMVDAPELLSDSN
jgi:hypothetical protein